METTFDFCHILDNSRVLILPMRNGNEDSARRSAAGWVGVLILPMRNGNDLGEDINMEIFAKGSYPTYEEWKPSALLVS